MNLLCFGPIASAKIMSVLDRNRGLGDAGCSVCEMAVVWAQNQMINNQSVEFIKTYLNNVRHDFQWMFLMKAIFRKCS